MRARARSVLAVGVNVRVQVWDARTPALEQAARDGHGRLVRETHGHNRVPMVGRNRLVALLANDGVSGLTRFKLGTDDTATSDEDTALGAEVMDAAIRRLIQTPSTLVAQFFLGTAQLNGVSLYEAGLFTADDVLGARYLIGAVPEVQPKTAGNAVTFTWTLVFSQA